MNKEIISYIKLLSDDKQIQKLLIETIGNILLKQDNIENYIKINKSKIIHIKDWIVSINNNEVFKKPRVLTIDALNNAADKYFEKKNNKLQTIKLDEEHEKLIADLGDYYIVQMLTPEALDNESKVMQHCIGHGEYDENLDKEEYKYLSLRGKNNKAHVTLEIKNNEILQLQGKQNDIPEQKYLDNLLPWLIENKYQINSIGYELIFNKNDNKIYSIYNLPDNCEIDGDLEFFYADIEKLPDNLKINGNLYITCCKNLEKLPDNLFISETLNIEGCFKIKYIPEDIVIGKDIILMDSGIEKLPDNLIVNGDLKLNKSKIKKIPNNLTVNGDIEFISTQIEELPNDIKNNGYIDLSYSNIRKLPDNLTVNKYLNLNFCKKLKELPNGLTVNGDLFCASSSLEKIPEDLIVNGQLNFEYCENLIEIPDNLIIKGDLELSHTKVKKLRDNLVIDGDLNLYNCQFKQLPKNLTVNGYLNLKCTDIKEIPTDLKVKILDIYNIDIKCLPDNLECDCIYITDDQIDLIKETLNFKKIMVNLRMANTKEEFFQKYKKECSQIDI